ncbi:MAG TPA: glycosyltransferase family 4 protein [Thermoanaerobaculia bacterium]|nr:glycosyltransferase family 4 protein [Thermoanaerobaculia bacterium]
MKSLPSRLLFVSAGMSPRGGGIAAAGRLLLGATRAWAEQRGVEVRLLTLGTADELPAGCAGEAFTGNRGRLARAVWAAQTLHGFRHHVYDFLGVARIQGVLPATLRARYLLYVYGIECWRPLRRSRRRALEGASRVLACSEHTARALASYNPWAPRVDVVHLALPDERPAGEPDRVADEVGESFLLIVGRMAASERYKGHDEVLQALRRLSAMRPGLRLVVVGEGDDRERLEALAKELGIADRVRFTGFVDDAALAALYERCAALVMPSAREGFGFVYLEAMRAGKPCIALRESAAAEIVVDGETGLLVAPGPDALADAIEELLRDEPRSRRMGAAGRERWRHEFRPARFAEALAKRLDLLTGLVSTARPAVPAGVRVPLLLPPER